MDGVSGNNAVLEEWSKGGVDSGVAQAMYPYRERESQVVGSGSDWGRSRDSLLMMGYHRLSLVKHSIHPFEIISL